jgi:hypothetical protein
LTLSGQWHLAALFLIAADWMLEHRDIYYACRTCPSSLLFFNALEFSSNAFLCFPDHQVVSQIWTAFYGSERHPRWSTFHITLAAYRRMLKLCLPENPPCEVLRHVVYYPGTCTDWAHYMSPEAYAFQSQLPAHTSNQTPPPSQQPRTRQIFTAVYRKKILDHTSYHHGSTTSIPLQQMRVSITSRFQWPP